jgi:hypothetical protein
MSDLANFKLNKLLLPIFEQADVMAAELRTFLERHGFQPSYIEACVEDMRDGWLNSDTIPLWHRPGYKPP